MSLEALNWAFNLNLSSSGQKLVLLTLANYSDELGEAFPSQKALAFKTCLSERAIRYNLTKLEEAGVITRIARTRQDGSYTSDLFRLNVGMTIKREEAEHPAADSAVGRIFQTQRQILPNPAADSAGLEPSLKTTITKNNHTPRELLKNRGLPDQISEAWIRVRKAKDLAITEPALEAIQREADKVGWTFEQAIRKCCEESWGGFKASWIHPPNPTPSANKPNQGAPPWWASDELILAKGRELGVEARPGETMGNFKGRINAKIAESAGSGARSAAQGTG